MLKSKGLSAKSIKNVHGVIHESLTKAVQLHYIRENPSDSCELPKTLKPQIYPIPGTVISAFIAEIRKDELSALIKEKSGIDFGNIIDLIPVERGKSGRLSKLKIVGTKRTLTIGKELEIRRTLSPTHLYSSAFIVEKGRIKDGVPQSFLFIGAGWGHGVGLCQIGAAVMGEQGYTYRQILFHYYKNAQIISLYQ